MCGIAGTVTFSEPAAEIGNLGLMLDKLRYRGPDEASAHYGKNWGIGARRLRIVSLDNGSQPFTSAHGAVCVFNGEIYNHASLRASLQSKGVAFRTGSDGEVIVHLYEKHGLDFVHHLQGMFACAIYDPAAQRVVLVRDRLGKKPLFYYHNPANELVFGSSMNAVVAAPQTPRRIDPEAIDYYLSYRIIPAPLTIFRDVRKVRPGCLLVIDAAGKREVRYWQPPQDEDNSPVDEAQAAEELRGLLEEAVLARIPSEVPYGFFLSGGLDSSLVAALGKRLTDRPLSTYSIGFNDAAFDERGYARHVAESLDARHTEYEITPSDIIKAVPELCWHFGEPFAFPSSIACYYMSKLARRDVPVVLGGDGADELFAGYHRYSCLFQNLGLSPGSRDSIDMETLGAAYESVLIDGVRNQWKFDLMHPKFQESLAQPSLSNKLLPRLNRGRNQSTLNRILALDAGFWLTDAQLCKVDVASMANALEVRHPMLDERLVDFACRLPADLKLRNGEGKYLLRRVAEPLVPSVVMNRSKHELSLPIENLLAGNLRDQIVRTLSSERCLERGYFVPDKLRCMVADFDSSKAYAIWTLYVLEQWHLSVLDKL